MCSWIRKRINKAERTTNDTVNAAKNVSGLITSGKVLNTVKDVAGDARNLVNASKGLIGNNAHSQALSLIDRSQNKANNFHEIANKYNEQAKQLGSQFDKQMMVRRN